MYRIGRWLLRLLVVLLLLSIGAFVYLRVYGIPDPLLRELIHRANAAGIPVGIDHVALTIHGWRATNVRYYSKYPDDLEPIVHAREVLFKRAVLPEDIIANGREFDFEAVDVSLAPSLMWGVDVPEASAFRHIDGMQLSVAFLPERIQISRGTMEWLGAEFSVAGTFLRTQGGVVGEDQVPETGSGQQTTAPVLISARQFQRFETWMKTLRLNGDASVDIKFLVDAENYAASQVECAVKVDDFEFRDISFSGAELSVRYASSRIQLTQAILRKDNQSCRIEGEYDLEAGQVQAAISNAIASKRMLLLLPQQLMDLLAMAELHFESLPEVDLRFGPSHPSDLLNEVSGSFVLRNAMYRSLEIETMSGVVMRKNNRLELKKLRGTVAGQEHRAEEAGSCMVGGSATGEVFWDSATHEFGVVAEGSLDPHLLLEPLSISTTATNVIRRFRFDAQPPKGSVQLGACYDDWDTFFINVHAAADNMRVHGVPFSSVNVSAFYDHEVLRLDPVVAMQGVEFIKGAVSLDFGHDTASFDAQGGVSPVALEDVIYPELDFFGNKIVPSGKTRIAVRGSVDWRTMRTTDFIAEVVAEKVATPMGVLDNFSATVSGKGPVLSVSDAAFDLFGGKGTGGLSVSLDPLHVGMPYKIDCSVDGVDFNQCLDFVRPSAANKASGRMSGQIQLNADFSRDFFEVANGKGRIDVVDGQLADLPLFSGFSWLVRKMLPSFSIFSINRLTAVFEIKEGIVYSDNAYFDGDIISAKGRGSYSRREGFDAYVQVQVLSDNRISKIFRFLTDPILKFFEMKLEGPLSEPSWRLEKFSGGSHAQP